MYSSRPSASRGSRATPPGILRHSFLPFVLEALHLRSGGQGQEDGGKRLRDGLRSRGEMIGFFSKENIVSDMERMYIYVPRF